MADEPLETCILDDVTVLHRAVYARLAAAVPVAVPGAEVYGFDSGHTNPRLPQIGVRVTAELEIDRDRPSPSHATRIFEPAGDEIIRTYPRHGTYTGYNQRTIRRPLPITLNYMVHTWCHAAETQLALDMAVLAAIPDRGMLPVEIDGTTYGFPIELISPPETLDDLTINLRERVHRFRVEAYIPSSMPDGSCPIITTITETTYSGGEAADINVQSTEQLDELTDTPEDSDE